MSRKSRQIEAGCAVPLWVITFSDMVTLLLTFFVLLVSLGHVRDDSLFDNGQELSSTSFLIQVKTGFGFRKEPDFKNVKFKHAINVPDSNAEGRTIDAKQEEIQRALRNIHRFVKTTPSQMAVKSTHFSAVNVHFSPGEAALDDSARQSLNEFCLLLQQTADAGPIRLYVLGLANDQVEEKEQWLLSAKRAAVVAEFLESALPETIKRPIYSWGAGPGGDWVGQDSPISKQSQIVIVVLSS